MKLALAAFAALALTPLAVAQSNPSGCKPYEDLIAAAPAKFKSFRAAKLGPGTYATTLRPALYPKCLISAQVESAFICLSNSGSETLIRVSYRNELARIRKCLPGWETAPLIHVEGLGETADGLRFIQKTANGDFTIAVGLAREKVGERLYRMSFGVIWRPPFVGA